MKKNKKFRSLSFTSAIAFLILIAVVLSISNGLQIYFDARTQRHLIAGRQNLIAEKAANTVRNFTDSKFDILKTAARVSDFVIFENNRQKLILEKLLGLEAAFRQVVLLDTNKQELARSSRLSNLLSGQLTEQYEQNKKEIFDSTIDKKSYISSVYIDKVTYEPMVIMAVGVTDVFSDFKGVLLAEVNLKFMWDLVGGVKVGNKGLAYVIDRNADLIAFSDVGRVLKGENLKNLRQVSEFIQGEDNVVAEISRGINGNYVVSSWVALDVPNWAVIIEQPVEEAYEPVIQAFKFTAGTMLVSFILAIAAGVYLAKRITKPLVNLRNAARIIGSGDMNAKIEVVSNDEIGELAASFNQMIEDLNKTTVSRNALAEEVIERKKAENELEQVVRKLEEANQELKNFVYIASHDLREPLRKVSAFGRILKQSLGEKLSGDDLENLQFMVDGAHRMTQMVEGLLSYSRVSTKGNKFEPVSINSIIKEIEAVEVSALLEEKNVLLQVEENLPDVIADSVQLRQLFQNMIANGVKYQPKDDNHKPLIRIWCQPAANDMVRINITDNGIGIKPEFQQAIFIMFKRLHAKNEYEGTGIGLAVCKKIVERNGGQIGVDSEYGKGSTFWFTLPLARQPVASEAVS